jgi:hypothetical protein
MMRLHAPKKAIATNTLEGNSFCPPISNADQYIYTGLNPLKRSIYHNWAETKQKHPNVSELYLWLAN